MEWLRSKSLVNALLFPAPEPSYRWCDFPGSLVWIPHDARDPGAVSPPAPLAGFYVQNPRGATHVLLYLHGNGEDLGHIRDHLVDYARQWRVHVLAVEYPGYGANSRHGPPANEDTVVGAARSALRFIGAALGVPPARTILFGRSIGTGPATLLAAELAEAEGAGAMSSSSEPSSPAALILQSPYTSIKSLATVLVGPAARLMLPRLVTSSVIGRVRCPILFLHGKKDDLIPFGHSLELREMAHASRGTECVLWEDSGHDEWHHQSEMVVPVRDFLAAWVDGRDCGPSPSVSRATSGNVDHAAVARALAGYGLDQYGEIDPHTDEDDLGGDGAFRGGGGSGDGSDAPRILRQSTLEVRGLIDIVDLGEWSTPPPEAMVGANPSSSSSRGPGAGPLGGASTTTTWSSSSSSTASSRRRSTVDSLLSVPHDGPPHDSASISGIAAGPADARASPALSSDASPQLQSLAGTRTAAAASSSSAGWFDAVIDSVAGGIATFGELTVGAFASDSPPRRTDRS